MAGGKTNPLQKNRPFGYSDFEEAKKRLREAIDVGPFYGLLLGPSGSGKTSLLREIAAALDRHHFQVHYLAQSCTSSAGIVRFLTEALRIIPWRSRTETILAIAQSLKALPLRVILFVDEAHRLSADALQEFRLIAESELDSPPLFTVVLAGVPELKTKLESPALFPLWWRLSVKVELKGLKENEVRPFLVERLGEAQVSRFPPEGLAAIFERVRGIPAFVAILAGRCLASTTKERIDMETILEQLESWEIT